MRYNLLLAIAGSVGADPCSDLCTRDGPSVCTGGSWNKNGVCHAYFFVGDSTTEYCYHSAATASSCPATGNPVKTTDASRLLSATTQGPSIYPEYIARGFGVVSSVPHPWRSHPKAHLSGAVRAIASSGVTVADPLSFWAEANMNQAFDLMDIGFDARYDNAFLYGQFLTILEFLNIPAPQRQQFGTDSGLTAALTAKLDLVARLVPSRISNLESGMAQDLELLIEFCPSIVSNLYLLRSRIIRDIFAGLPTGGSEGISIQGHRQSVWTDSLPQLSGAAETLRRGVSSVAFVNSEYNSPEEWYAEMDKAIADPAKAGLVARAATQDYMKVIVNPSASLEQYKVLGRFLAMSFLDFVPLKVQFSTSFWAYILDRDLTIDQVEYTDGPLALTLSRIMGATSDQELESLSVVIEGTAHTVTLATRDDLVQRSLAPGARVSQEVLPQLAAVKQGFLEVIPASYLTSLDVREVVQLYAGRSEILIADMKTNLPVRGNREYPDYSDIPVPTESTLVQMGYFWEIVEAFSADEHRNFLRMMSGLEIVPYGGWAYVLDGSLQIYLDQSETELNWTSYPYLKLTLPTYTCKAEMEAALMNMMSGAMHAREL